MEIGTEEDDYNFSPIIKDVQEWEVEKAKEMQEHTTPPDSP